MEVEHKDMVDKNYYLFTELLRLKNVPMIQYLYDEQVLTEKIATRAMSHALPSARTMHYLNNMLKSDIEEFQSLYAAILYTKLWRAADILEPKKRPHERTYEGEKIPLPEVWPDEAYFKELQDKELKVENVDPNDALMQEFYEESRKNQIYEMRKKIKGRVLIINNYNFEKQKVRWGSEKDVEGLTKIFTQLGFEPEAHQDLKCSQMTELLKKECKRDHSNYNCFFLIIMAHGSQGLVYGTDGYRSQSREEFCNCLYIKDIKEQFVQVKDLERKPKVFIFQACQGNRPDRGIKHKSMEKEVDEQEEEEDDHSVNPITQSVGQNLVDDGNEAVNSEDNEEPEEAYVLDPQPHAEDDELHIDHNNQINLDMEDSITAEAPFHFLVAEATTEGNYAYLNTAYGSWFIQAFIFVLAKYAWKEDLLTLLEKVNELVRKAKTPKEKDKPMHFMQVSKVTNTFIKRFFFFPGLPLEPSAQTKKNLPLSDTPGATILI